MFIFSAYGQSDRGTITGTVADPSSAAVAGAKIEVRSWAYLNVGYSLNGLGYNSVRLSAPSFDLVSSQLSNGIVYSPAALSTQTLSPGVNTMPGQLNTFSNVWGGLYNDPGTGRPGRIN